MHTKKRGRSQYREVKLTEGKSRIPHICSVIIDKVLLGNSYYHVHKMTLIKSIELTDKRVALAKYT